MYTFSYSWLPAVYGRKFQCVDILVFCIWMFLWVIYDLSWQQSRLVTHSEIYTKRIISLLLTWSGSWITLIFKRSKMFKVFFIILIIYSTFILKSTFIFKLHLQLLDYYYCFISNVSITLIICIFSFFVKLFFDSDLLSLTLHSEFFVRSCFHRAHVWTWDDTAHRHSSIKIACLLFNG